MAMKLVAVLTTCLFLCLHEAAAAASPPPDEYMVKDPNCPYWCGEVQIPFPFGIGEGCYMNEWYSVNCITDSSSGARQAFLNHTKLNLQLLSVSIELGIATVNSPVASFTVREGPEQKKGLDLVESPFVFSGFDNIFVVLGCGHATLIDDGKRNILTGCTSIDCRSSYGAAQRCDGISCCQSTIPTMDDYYLTSYTVNLSSVMSDDAGGNNSSGGSNSSTHAFLVDMGWFSSNFTLSDDVNVPDGKYYAPVSLIWMLKEGDAAGYSCNNTVSYSSWYESYVRNPCSCNVSEEGNPFLPHGCHVVKECARCHGKCGHRSVPDQSYQGYYYEYYCIKKDISGSLILGFGTSGGSLLLILGSIGLYKVVKKKREIRLKRKFFKQNGGLLLEQQISSNKVVERAKIFTSKELEKATDNFNMDRILGQGGQGTVYKGMLTNGRIIAVKKSKIVDKSQIKQFINEIEILSQINHRNIVGLLGCCLETEVPLLVYEFISNGNLFQLIHNQDMDSLFSWEMRLQIAIEVAGALAYLHSACSLPVYHRDIKSSNILLDDKYRAKVSDFGISRSIAIEQTHVTTRVQGTFGYLDPEYFQSSQFTDKSDVYSFGVVLVELLTGQKPICSTKPQEERSLATHFILSLEESRLFDILDARVVKEAREEEIMAVACLAYRCLNLNGRSRPTMKEVAAELEHIRASLPHLKVEQNFEENIRIGMEITEPSSCIRSCMDCHKATSPDEQPLLFKTL